MRKDYIKFCFDWKTTEGFFKEGLGELDLKITVIFIHGAIFLKYWNSVSHGSCKPIQLGWN